MVHSPLHAKALYFRHHHPYKYYKDFYKLNFTLEYLVFHHGGPFYYHLFLTNVLRLSKPEVRLLCLETVTPIKIHDQRNTGYVKK